MLFYYIRECSESKLQPIYIYDTFLFIYIYIDIYIGTFEDCHEIFFNSKFFSERGKEYGKVEWVVDNREREEEKP